MPRSASGRHPLRGRRAAASAPAARAPMRRVRKWCLSCARSPPASSRPAIIRWSGDRYLPHPEEARSAVSKDGKQTRCSFPPFETRPDGSLIWVSFPCLYLLPAEVANGVWLSHPANGMVLVILYILAALVVDC